MSTQSRGRRPFEKSSYKHSFPIRCKSTEKMHPQAREDAEQRQVIIEGIENENLVREQMRKNAEADAVDLETQLAAAAS